MEQKDINFVLPAHSVQNIANALSKKKVSSYETLGDLFLDLSSIIAISGLTMPKLSKEGELKQKCDVLEKEMERLKNGKK